MNLAIDWGNTRIKVGWFADDTLVETARYATANDLGQALHKTPPHRVIVSSTSIPADVLRLEFQPFDPESNWLMFNSKTSVPIQNDYGTPGTLGADRLAAAVGAAALFPQQPCLILDLGTCLTADFLSANGTFRGGLISPGLRMRLQAMHTFTARLPLLTNLPDADAWPPLLGRTTQEALFSGAMNGMALELAGIIADYTNHYAGLRVLVCGGDGPLFLNRLKPGIFAVPALVLQGLNHVLRLHIPS